MPTKGLLPLVFIAGVALTSVAFAQAPAHDTFFGAFDLKRAVLSPVPLGPPSQFEPRTSEAPQKADQPQAERIQAEQPRPANVSRTPKQQQKLAAPTRKPRSNPLDSYARDPRGQVWPCVGDGICAWTQPR
jgi:hypothetical protein